MRTGRLELGAAAEAIGALGADVVAVQEVDRGLPRTGGVDQVAELAARTGLHGVFAPALLGDPDTRWTSVPATDPGGPGYGIGLLSRTPLSAVRRIALPGGGDGERSPRGASKRSDAPRHLPAPRDQGTLPGASLRNPGYDREPRIALAGTVLLDGVAVVVATVHLSYLPWRGLAQVRAAGAALSAEPGPGALIGDFNLPAWPVRLALGDGWLHAGGGPTYPAWSPRLQVDQLLVRGGLTVRDLGVGPAATSDHLPLFATVTLPQRPESI